MMISSWRKRRASRRGGKDDQSNIMMEKELQIPSHFRCPISLDLMKDPVTLSTGITYDRESIEKWMEAGNFKCPTTNQVLTSAEPVPNHTIRKVIQDWCVENRSYGIERIPTPRIPVSSAEIQEILLKISVGCKNGDRIGCRDLAAKINRLAKESERNKRCIASSKTGGVLAEAFDVFTRGGDQNAAVLDEILSTLTLFPLDAEAKAFLGTSSSIDQIILSLTCGDLTRRRNAVLVLKELISYDKIKANELSEIRGIVEALIRMIKEPICPTTTKASLTIIYQLVTSPKVSSKLIQTGMVPLLLELLVECDRSICEKALGILDRISSIDEGREAVCDNALGMPVLVKKILRVSNLATEFSVSILWKLCKMATREDDVVVDQALQVGAFQKLLVVLQVGCGERTKEKVTELLKLLNLSRYSLECVDSVDFKGIKRPF